MKIPTPQPSPWPRTKIEVLAVAKDWYDASRVGINEEAIAKLDLPAPKVGEEGGMAIGAFSKGWRDESMLALALNSINHQFWDLDDGRFVRYDFEGIVGAMGMREAFERAWNDPQSPLNQALQGQPMTVDDVRQMFGDIPAAEGRAAILNEVLTSPQLPAIAGDICDAIERGEPVNTQMAHRLAEAFPVAYGDPVLKKCQLAVSEVWVKANEAGHAVGCDLTAFADYQIPNILRAMGVLEYAPDLAEAIDGFKPIDYNSGDEQAIRAASLLAVEQIAQHLNAPVAAVDHYLWTRRKEAQTPFHLTFTTAY